MQSEKCKSCFECTETVVVKVRDDRGSEWRDSSVRRCANDQCWHIVDGSREDRLRWISNVYDYKYFGDYDLSPEQLAAVYEAKSLAALSADLSAQVQDDSEIVDCLLAGKPFVFDPATNFCHADDGGAPEHGIKYVPAAQVKDVAGAPPVDSRHRFEPNSKYPWFCAVCGYAPHEPLKHLPAAPAKQEG